MKRIISYVLLAFLFVNVSAAQSVDERIGNAINSESWHQLRKIYMEEGGAYTKSVSENIVPLLCGPFL